MALKKISLVLFFPMVFFLALACQSKVERTYHKGVGLMYAGNFAEAKKEFSAGLKKYPKSGKLAYGVGWTELMEGDVSRALALFGQAIKNEEGFFGGYKGMATLYLMMGSPDKSLEYYKEALKRDEKNPSIHSNLGDLYRQQGKFDEAKLSYETAQKLLVGFSDIDNGFIALAIEQGDDDKAIALGKDTLQKKYQQVFLKGNALDLLARAHFNKAKNLFEKKDVAGANAQLDEASKVLIDGEKAFGSARFVPLAQEIQGYRSDMKKPRSKGVEKSKGKISQKPLGQQIFNQEN